MAQAQIVLIRHATAEGRTPSGSDEERPLSEYGVKQARALGAWLKEQGFLPDAVLCSPATRTRQTWQEIVEATKSGVMIEIEPEIYEAHTDALMERLSRVDDDLRRIALVGHAPGIPMVAFDLDDGEGTLRDELARGFAPASVAVVELDVPVSEIRPGVGRLVALLDGDTL